MAAQVFGRVSSPSCSNHALKKTASDNLNNYGEYGASILRWNFYVDDMLKSFSSIEEAIRITGEVKELCKEGGFNFTKFSSNNLDVLKTIQDNDGKDGVKDKDLAIGVLAEDKAFGVRWNVGEDTLGFQIKMCNKPVTRHGLLAALSSVYDPLALGAPSLLKGRPIIQNLCRNNLTWDEPVDDSSSYEWLKWRNQLMTLQDMNITRCIKPKNFGKIIHCSLNYFFDACETGYGMSAYIRLVNAENVVH